MAPTAPSRGSMIRRGTRWSCGSLKGERPRKGPSKAVEHMPTYDREHWERLWNRTVQEHADVLAHRPPNAHFLNAVTELPAGRALDAGCGHGAETLWLAAQGWEVTAVDFADAALAHARSAAEALGPEVAGRVEWIQGDLGNWMPDHLRHDLVICLYVHVAGAVSELVQRLASGVAPSGTLLLVGHRPIDPATGAPTSAAGQLQVSVEEGLAALDPEHWTVVAAEDRPRNTVGSGVDAVIQAIRKV
jgi:SAM-dependent methyltransferase